MINEIRSPLAMCNCVWQIYIELSGGSIRHVRLHILNGNVVLIMLVCIALYFVKFQL